VGMTRLRRDEARSSNEREVASDIENKFKRERLGC
jgi:hypothetical protein